MQEQKYKFNKVIEQNIKKKEQKRNIGAEEYND